MNSRIGFYIVFIITLLIFCGCAPNPAEQNNRGNDLFMQGNMGEALKAYQAAQVLAPDHPLPYMNASIALADSGDFEYALAAFSQSLKTADVTTAAQGYYNLGNLYFQQSLYAEAVTAYQESLLRNPLDHDARYNLELALQQLQPSPPPEQRQNLDLTTTPTLETTTFNEQTPTPAQGGFTPTPENSATNSPDRLSPNLNSTLSPQEAGQILDSVQQQQSILPKTTAPAPNTLSEKDW